MDEGKRLFQMVDYARSHLSDCLHREPAGGNTMNAYAELRQTLAKLEVWIDSLPSDLDLKAEAEEQDAKRDE